MGTITILEQTDKNPITLMGKMAGVCYGSDITNDQKNYKRGMDCILSGHGRILEYVNVAMIIDGYSAKFYREFYTHIGGSPTRTQASTRYINYTKGAGFNYVVPKTIQKNLQAEDLYVKTMAQINEACRVLEQDFGIPREDASMLLPLGMNSKVVDKRNLRNWIDMSRVRECSRAWSEYREFFADVKTALREYSDEWAWVVDNLFHPKCEEYGYCNETKSCGRKPRKEER